MTLLRTYIVLAVLRGVATVMAVLVAVTCVIEFVGQLNDVGTGDYALQTALIYIGLRVPGRIFDMLPIGALIGSLLSGGILDYFSTTTATGVVRNWQSFWLSSAAMSFVITLLVLFFFKSKARVGTETNQAAA